MLHRGPKNVNREIISILIIKTIIEEKKQFVFLTYFGHNQEYRIFFILKWET